MAVFVLARIPSFFEPHWYADEAGYATVARELLRGKTLYVNAWNNKPPLQFWTLAVPVWLFGGSEAGLHALTFISGLLTLGAVAYAARELLSPWRSCLAVLAVGLVLGMPIMDAELIVPESLLIAPAAWAGVLLITRLSRPEREASGLELWPVAVGALTAAAIGYQQTAVADAAAFGLILAVAGRSWRRLALYAGTAGGLTAAWLAAMMAAAGPHRVGFALAGFYVDYTRSVLPQTVGGGLRHWGLVLLIVALICAGALLQRRNRNLSWGFWVWAGAVLCVSAAAHQAYAHFLAPAVAPTALALAAIPPLRAIPTFSRRIQGASLLLAAGVVTFGVMARSAGLDWIPNLSAPGMNTYRNLQTYYGGAAWAAADPGHRDAWQYAFDDRVKGDAAAAAWIRAHGLSGHSTVVWSNEPWPYLLADVPLLLPTPPIYNDMTLLGNNGPVAVRVRQLNPELIVAAVDATQQYPEVNPVLHQNYRAVESDGIVTVWLRRGL
ncbi:MAG: hypothetical protein J2P45_07525, partial [Candidatus Dormibacteraeota bacterium]|nr:hypothetical protein [Candidatus Dormibacteraeota bacterium]